MHRLVCRFIDNLHSAYIAKELIFSLVDKTANKGPYGAPGDLHGQSSALDTEEGGVRDDILDGTWSAYSTMH